MTVPSSLPPSSGAPDGGVDGDGAPREPGALLLWILLAAMAAGPVFNYAVSASSTVVIGRLGITSGQLGTVLTVVFAAAAVTSVGLGRAADSLSSCAQMSIIFGGTAVALILGAFAPTLAVLYLAAAVAGVTQAISNPTTNRIIRTAVPARRRVGWVGVKQSGVQVSQLFAGLFFPAVALTLGWTGAALVAAGVIGVLWIVAVRSVPPLPGAQARPTPPDVGSRAADMAHPARVPMPRIVWFCASIAFLTGLGMQAINMYLPLFAVESLGLSLVVGGAAAAVSGAVGVASRIGWGRRMTAGDRPTTLLALICVGAVLGVLVFLAADTWHLPALLWVGAGLHGLTVLGANVVLNAALLDAVPADRLGRASGVNSMGMYAGFAAGPLLMGLLRDVRGDFTLGFVFVGLAYVLALVVVVLLRRHVDRTRADRTPESGSANGRGAS